VDPRTPVVVGVGTITQRQDDPLLALDVVDLMAAAARAAAEDAGAPDLARRAGLILVPRGSWPAVDAGRIVAERLGNTGARTVLAEIGVLQTTLIDRAARAVASGQVDTALVVGGEARWRQTRAAAAGVSLPPAPAHPSPPDETLRPEVSIVAGEEVTAGLTSAPSQYALIENARRAADHQPLDEHRRAVARLWADIGAGVRHNPEAWHRRPRAEEEIAEPGPDNRMIAFPYNKWHCSQWNVDQAGCLLVCSVEVARARGVSPDRWVFLHSLAESNHVLPVSCRTELHRSPGFELAGRAALNLAGVGIDDVAHLDLYSCFPIAVRIQLSELSVRPGRPLSVTGGMTFGGGPLNNYVIQSTAAMARTLRHHPGERGMVTAVSGLLTKQGVTVWSTDPPGQGYRSLDVSEATGASAGAVPIVAAASGRAVVATYTVLTEREGPATGVVLADLAGGGRTLATTQDRDTVADMTEREWCGVEVALDGQGGFAPAP